MYRSPSSVFQTGDGPFYCSACFFPQGVENSSYGTQRGWSAHSFYDPEILNPYWQKLDFGFRAHMWGEQLLCSTSLRIRYLGEHEAEDTTPDESYGRFYLKNLAVRFDSDAGSLPLSRFLSYAGKRGGSPIARIKEFREASEWVKTHRFRFCRDARSVTELWESEA